MPGRTYSMFYFSARNLERKKKRGAWARRAGKIDVQESEDNFLHYNSEVKPESLDDDIVKYYHPNQLCTRCRPPVALG